MTCYSNYENNFPHKLPLTNIQAANLRKAFASKSSTDTRRWISFSWYTSLSITKYRITINEIQPLAKSVLIPLELTAAASPDVGRYKNILGTGNNTATLIISNKIMEDIIKIVKSLDDSGLLVKGISETIQNEAKERKGGFLSMLFGVLGASLLENMLQAEAINRAGDGIIKSDYRSKKGFLMPPHHLTKLEIQRYF